MAAPATHSSSAAAAGAPAAPPLDPQEAARIEKTRFAATQLFPIVSLLLPEKEAVDSLFVQLYSNCKRHHQIKVAGKDLACFRVDFRKAPLLDGRLLEVVLERSAPDPTTVISPEESSTWTWMWSFTFLNPPDKKPLVEEYHLLPKYALSKEEVDEIMACYNGREVEIFTPLGSRTPPAPRPHWRGWRNVDSLQRQFSCLLYPRVYYAFNLVCCYFSPHKYSILDLGGHDGEVSIALLDRCSRISEAICVDSDLGAYKTALATIACPHTLPTTKARFTPILADIREKDLTKFTRRAQVDVVLLVGVTGWGILTHKESYNLMISAKEALKPGGLAVITSLSIHHLNSKDYAEMGFEILNTSSPMPPDLLSAAEGASGPYGVKLFYADRRGFYILRKS